ncbi:response regulator transcription factor [Microbacterium sp. KUDC0406]|uniref:response regulator n=1 Tax=Microbacterium sp. KUDC0406 TaxID=2909588 RepID=UPI001F3C9171|nr:response regulator transcription factor [Microbacterium sp. KUDC0406]UJP09245.1 response regulator transcription factor [Microbacterium sp. KUDC0406]
MTTELPSPVRVLLVDDDPLVRSGLRLLLKPDQGIEIIGEAADGGAAVEFVRAHHPDVVLMDVRMPGVAGPEATAAIVQQSSSRVLAMTSFDSEDQLLKMLTAGASGYLMKDDVKRFADAVLSTARGEIVVSGTSTAQLVRRAVSSEGGAGRQPALERISGLTERELAVARGVASGATNPQIGADLHISAGTVKTHLEQVFVKLGVRGRVQVGVILERAGLGPAEV